MALMLLLLLFGAAKPLPGREHLEMFSTSLWKHVVGMSLCQRSCCALWFKLLPVAARGMCIQVALWGVQT